ncbi:phage tail assembly chaperone [Moritella viscosa]|uniref:phage tail assembly chaperone n=1 Tax=Moritella viscosa TaxID=80854 RepID=UPI0009161A39|nr:phage tail assembly chaperone [Moritella viscosa]SGY98792.1 Putative uncharacterized protein [Moritella viscosa]
MEQLIKFVDLHPICQMGIIREQRAPLLDDADRLISIALDKGVDATLFRQYRQALRDIPQTFESAQDVVWPTKPSLPQASV